MKNTDNRLDELEEQFNQADEDGDGQISLTEFRDLMLDVDPHMRDSTVSTTFLAIDANNDGRIGFTEFRSWSLRD